MKQLTRIALAMSVAAAALAAGTAHADQTYNVTFTNLTRGQIISPPVLFSHQEGVQLFTLGAPASPGLAKLAEDGMTDDLVAELHAQAGVHEIVVAPDGIPPGGSMTVQINTKGNYRYLSAASMLVTSNDAFFAIRDVRVPPSGHRVVDAEAYDAGSETNSEACAFIPGPPCGNGGVRDTSAAEGYVHVHAGIHGGADLVPAEHDWRNPVVEVIVERVN